MARNQIEQGRGRAPNLTPNNEFAGALVGHQLKLKNRPEVSTESAKKIGPIAVAFQGLVNAVTGGPEVAKDLGILHRLNSANSDQLAALRQEFGKEYEIVSRVKNRIGDGWRYKIARTLYYK